MPSGRLVLVLLLMAPLPGCLTPASARLATRPLRSGDLQGPVDLDVIQMNVAVLEVGVGDPYVNEDLWGLADEQQVPVEKKARLRENGFRVGQVRGITPPGLQSLLTSERNNPKPRLKQTRAGDACSLDLGPALAQCQCQVREDGRSTAVEMMNAQTGFEITPTLTPDGSVCLQFKPQIRAAGSPAQRSSNLPLWMVLTQRPTRKFDNLTWDVILQPNEYVVVGGRLDQNGSLGHRTFLDLDEAKPVQRLLVIRTARVLPALPLDDPGRPREELEALKQRPPLALQAAMSPVPSGPP
jgi:hypothetical protein